MHDVAETCYAACSVRSKCDPAIINSDLKAASLMVEV